MMQFEKGSRVTGRVIGLDGAGLAKVGIWCKRLDWRGRGPAPTKLTSTGADGTFSIPPIATGRHVLQIITRDLGAKELAVAFANPVIEAKDDAPVELEIRPLPTVELTFDARVTRANAEFRDFEVRVSGTLPGTKAGDPAAYWTRQETTKLAEGKHTIAVPAGLQNTSIRAGGIYMRRGDAPVFIWQRGSDAQPATTSIIELGIMDKPQTISVTVRDAQQEENLEARASRDDTRAEIGGSRGTRGRRCAPAEARIRAEAFEKLAAVCAQRWENSRGGLIDQLAEQIESFIKQTPEGKDTVALGLQLARCYILKEASISFSRRLISPALRLDSRGRCDITRRHQRYLHSSGELGELCEGIRQSARRAGRKTTAEATGIGGLGRADGERSARRVAVGAGFNDGDSFHFACGALRP